jgi:hypothetical protein
MLCPGFTSDAGLIGWKCLFRLVRYVLFVPTRFHVLSWLYRFAVS